MIRAFALLAFLARAQDPAAVADTTPAPVAPVPSAVPTPQKVHLQTRNHEAEKVLNAALTDATYWNGASKSTYNDKSWDEVRLKQLSTGYLAMISGEGGQDFDHDVVVDVVY